MQPDGDRDRAVDRALRQTLRASARELEDGHIDGETLAALSDGQLRSGEREHVEQHLADCARCQQLLATFASTAPPPIVSEPLWRRWRLQWLVPIATAATVAAVWVAAPRERSQVQPPISDRATAQTSAAENEAAPSTASRPGPSATSEPARQAPQAPAAKAADAYARTERVPSALPPSAEEKRADTDSLRREAVGTIAAPPAGATQAPDADTRLRDEQSRSSVAETVQSRPEAPAAAPAAPRAAPQTAAAAQAPEARAGNAARALGISAFSPQPDIVSPNSAIRWRIVGGNRIERSTNGGGEWQAATLPSNGILTAGASPAPSICWIVGRGGVVYVTTEGLRFVRVAFPEPIDLVSVTAADERHATVISADGRSFRTDDQGMTWTR